MSDQALTITRWLWLEDEYWNRATKKSDTLLTVFVVDPLIRLVIPVALRLGLSPNQVTMIGAAVSLLTAWLFLNGSLAIGGLLFFIWYVIDCIDGKIARITNRCTQFGYWLDVFSDRLGTGIVIFALGVHYLREGDETTGLLALGFLFLWFFVTQNQATLSAIAPKFNSERLIQGVEANKSARSTVSGSDSSGSSGYVDFLRRYRLNPVLIHDIEWLMIALTIGPLTGRVYECLLLGGAGMFGYRALQTAGFWWRRRSEISTI
jgi:hypothetical protein